MYKRSKKRKNKDNIKQMHIENQHAHISYLRQRQLTNIKKLYGFYEYCTHTHTMLVTMGHNGYTTLVMVGYQAQGYTCRVNSVMLAELVVLAALLSS